jgi:hypothetical protein
VKTRVEQFDGWYVAAVERRVGTIVFVGRGPLLREREEIGRVARDREASARPERSYEEALEVVLERARQRAKVRANWSE